MAGGRPSEYREAYCAEVINLMGAGLSMTAAAAELGFHRETFLYWADKFPEFSDALKLAKGKRTAFLERQLLQEDSGPRVTARIFALKNAAPEEWRDRVEQDVTHRITETVDRPVNETREQWLERRNRELGRT